MNPEDEGIDVNDIQMQEARMKDAAEKLDMFRLASKLLAVILVITVLFVAAVLGLGAGVLAVSWFIGIWPW